ncbi:MAG TPA: hypothetical protein VLC92_11360 [Rhodocyclaceae bacterium]|nr:hypothetical protein [Rhodocyclaceae bacterium]
MALTLEAKNGRGALKSAENCAAARAQDAQQVAHEAAQLLRSFRFESYHAASTQLFGAIGAFTARDACRSRTRSELPTDKLEVFPCAPPTDQSADA